jgi:hypothetical protein
VEGSGETMNCRQSRLLNSDQLKVINWQADPPDANSWIRSAM